MSRRGPATKKTRARPRPPASRRATAKGKPEEPSGAGAELVTLREPAAPTRPLSADATHCSLACYVGLSEEERRRVADRMLREDTEKKLPGVDAVLRALEAHEHEVPEEEEDWPSELHPLHLSVHGD